MSRGSSISFPSIEKGKALTIPGVRVERQRTLTPVDGIIVHSTGKTNRPSSAPLVGGRGGRSVEERLSVIKGGRRRSIKEKNPNLVALGTGGLGGMMDIHSALGAFPNSDLDLDQGFDWETNGNPQVYELLSEIEPPSSSVPLLNDVIERLHPKDLVPLTDPPPSALVSQSLSELPDTKCESPQNVRVTGIYVNPVILPAEEYGSVFCGVSIEEDHESLAAVDNLISEFLHKSLFSTKHAEFDQFVEQIQSDNSPHGQYPKR